VDEGHVRGEKGLLATSEVEAEEGGQLLRNSYTLEESWVG